jgi:hypothetical protein
MNDTQLYAFPLNLCITGLVIHAVRFQTAVLAPARLCITFVLQPQPVLTLPTATACSSTQQTSQTQDGAHTSTGTRQCRHHR